MTFSEATKRRAISLLRDNNVRSNEKFSGLPDEIFDNPPFSDIDIAEQQALFEAVKHQLGSTRTTTPQIATSKSRPVEMRDPLPEESVKSPFLFVPLNEKILSADPRVGKALDRSRPLAGGFSGSIEVQWTVETPLLVGQTIAEQPFDHSQLEVCAKAIHPAPTLGDIAIPMALDVGQFVVPGATFKGLIRSTLQIVTSARLGNVNDNHRYGIRDFKHPLFAGDGETRPKRLTWDALGAGLLRQARAGDPEKLEGDSDYVIEPCEKRMVRMEDVIPFLRPHARPVDPNALGFPAWARAYFNWLSLELQHKYNACETFNGELLDTTPHVSFLLETGGSEGARYASPVTSGGDRQGFFVFAGKSPMGRDEKDKFETKLRDQLTGARKQGGYRRQEYAFFPIEGAQPVRVSARAWKQFRQLNSLPGKTTFRPTGSWETLEPTVRAGRPIPVFHTGSVDDQENPANRFELGLTRLFKIAHERSVGDVIAQHHPAHRVPKTFDPDYEPDMVEALLGYLLAEEDGGRESLAPSDAARKSRVGFGFGHLMEGQRAKWGAIRPALMMGPRASFSPFYLAAPKPGSVIDWSEPSSRLAGRKRYFPRYPAEQQSAARKSITAAIKDSIPTGAGPSTLSHMVFLEPAEGREMTFRSTIRFHNVLPEEIGAVLWALTFGGECKPRKPFRHMIGRGKPFGAGQCRVRRIDLGQLQGHDAQARAKLSPAAPWEVAEAAHEGWVAPDGRSLGPFLQAFDTMMTQHMGASWANSPQIEGLLHASALTTGAEIAGRGRGGYPQLDEFRKLRDAVKPDSKRVNTATPAKLLGTRGLPAKRPYLKL